MEGVWGNWQKNASLCRLGDQSISALSKSSGANKKQVQQVLINGLPTLIRNMQKNASTKSGAASLAKALSDHARDNTSDVSAFLGNADLADGAKILAHILGDKQKTVVSDLAKKADLSTDQTMTILAAAAPLLLSLLGKKKEADKADLGGLLTSLAGSLLSGGAPKKGSSAKKGGGDLGDVLADGLSSLLTDGKGQGGALGGILGSLLGSDAKTKKSGNKKKTTSKKKK